MNHLTLKFISFAQMEQLDADATAFALNLRDIKIQPEHTKDYPCRMKVKYYIRGEEWPTYGLPLKQCATAVQAWQDFQRTDHGIYQRLGELSYYSLYRESQCK